MMFHKKRLIWLFLAIFTPLAYAGQRPKVTVIFVVDQMAYRYIPKIGPYFKHGFKTLLNQGVSYTNAYHPHGMPATATGHAALNTGAFAKDHGIIGNRWVDAKGNKIVSDFDTPEAAAVFAPNGFYQFGASSKQLMVDGLSDQFVLASEPQTPRKAVSVSLKSRAATATAGKAGKAIWFDPKTGNFTSSLAYFNTIPCWLDAFNKKNNPSLQEKITWKSAYPLSDNAYKFSYTNFIHKPQLVGSTITVSPPDPKNMELFSKTPQANELVLNLAKQVFNQYTQKEEPSELLLWVCLSSLDKLGHDYGSNSLENIDMMYHLDKQIGDFMNYVLSHVPSKSDALFALSADHGVSPVIELVQKEGYSAARRIKTPPIKKAMNTLIEEKYGIKNVVMRVKSPNFYMSEEFMTMNNPKLQNNILQDLKKYLRSHVGIKNVWTYQELAKSTFTKNQKENFFKEQLYPTRSGQLIMQTYPYNMVTKWDSGADHRTPYNYDIHVPLVIYQPGVREKKVVNENVWTLQFANTLADILEVPRPSASIQEKLPGIE